MTNETSDTEAETAAIRERMRQPLSKEQIVASELWAQIETAERPVAEWDNDDWLRLARHVIKTVEVARDLSAEEIAEALNAPWPKDWPPLPMFDEL